MASRSTLPQTLVLALGSSLFTPAAAQDTIVSCGPDTYIHCYGPLENFVQTYQGDAGLSLHLVFNSGGIYVDGDLLTIHDGMDDTAPILYSGTGVNGDLTGLAVTSSNPDHALTLVFSSNDFLSCVDDLGILEWNYTVGCLDCDPATGVAGDVITACEVQLFAVDVEVTDLGSQMVVEIANDAGVPPTVVTTPGSYGAGPFPLGTPVTLTLVNDTNALCNTVLGTFVNGFCPIMIACGAPAFADSYCYPDNDNASWLYQNSGPEALALLFSAGTIESAFWDHLTIYDGVDNTAPVLFDHIVFNTFDLTGLLIVSTGPSIYMEMSSDGVGSCDGGFLEEWFWTVGCLDCTPPEAGFEVTLDCENGQYFITTTIDALGSDSTLVITNTGGAPNVAVDAAGIYASGPFALGIDAGVTVVSDENPLCNVSSPVLPSPICPLIGCGPSEFELCYGLNMDTVMVYQSDSGLPIALAFSQGELDTFGDQIAVYDGPDLLAPLLYAGNNGGDLTGLLFISTNAQDVLCVHFTSNNFGGCVSDGSAPLQWSVQCLDCLQPAGVAGEVITDCEAQSFTVSVEVTDLGSQEVIEIANDVNAPSTVVNAPGVYVAGPFTVGLPVTLTLVNDTNNLCNTLLGTFENSFCAIQINCGEPAVEASYCYGNNDNVAWLYENSGPEPLALLFTAGMIESSFWDDLVIYDGVDNTAPVIFEHTEQVTIDLAGLLAISTGPAIYMEMSSDGVISCAGGGGMEEWHWSVGCLDCVQPEASFDVTLDCDNSVFFITTTITELGSDSTITITNTGGAPDVPVTSAGVYDSGPFALGADVSVSIVTDENVLCSLHSEVLTSAPCPLIGCGPYQFELCYGDQMDTTIVYQSSSAFPIALLFNSGGAETLGDLIEVHDGDDLQAPLLYSGNNGGDLTGLFFTSTNPDNALCVRLVSDFFGSCEGGQAEVPWNWSVSCLDCTNPEASFELIPDCIHNGFLLEVNVTGLGTASDLRLANSWSLDTLDGIGLGITTVGPFPVDQNVAFTLLNSTNPLCRINSPEFVLAQSACVMEACEFVTAEHCYVNADTAWFIYASGNTLPITMSFNYGQLLPGDMLMIYNGIGPNAQLVFAGDLGGQVGGFAFTSNNPQNAVTFNVASDATGSCDDGGASPQIQWTAGCGLVGQADPLGDALILFPNPASSSATVRWPASWGPQVRIEVMDMTGRVVAVSSFAGGATQGILDTGSLAPGNYSVRCSGRSRIRTLGLTIIR